MEKMDVAKDQVVKMSAEDLEHAYDAVRVANRSVTVKPLLQTFLLIHKIIRHRVSSGSFRFLERQLRKQQSQQEEGLEAVRQRLHQAVSGSAQAEVVVLGSAGGTSALFGSFLDAVQLLWLKEQLMTTNMSSFEGPTGPAGGPGAGVCASEEGAEGAEEHGVAQTTPDCE